MYLQFYQKRILLTSILIMLLTAVVVGLSVALPLFKSAQQGIDKATRISVQAHTSSLDHLLQGYHNIAEQFTSRTEIRKRLVAYSQGDLSLQAAIDFSQPRLADAARKIPSLAAFYRLGPEGEIITRSHEGELGFESVSELFPEIKNTSLSFRQNPNLHKQLAPIGFYFTDTSLLIVATAPIRNPQKQVVGMDVLIFAPDHWLDQLQSPEHLHPSTQLYLYHPQNHQAWSIRNHQTQRLDNEDSLLSTLKQHTNQPYLTPMNQQEHTLFQSPLEQAPWDLIVTLPQSTLYHKAYDDLVWALVSIAMMMLIGGILTHQAIQPLIKRLSRQAEEIQASEKALRQAASVFDNTKEAIAITHADFRLSKVNHAFEQLLAGSDELARCRSLTRLMATESADPDHLRSILEQVEARGHWQGEIWYQMPSGEKLPALQTISAVRDKQTEQVEQLIHIFNDISQHKAKENHLMHLAHFDSLTQLPNRASTMQELERRLGLLKKEESLAVLFLDLDRFKPINDTYGHECGDEILRDVAKRLRHHVRPEDWVGRLGGDEFLILLTGTDMVRHARAIALKLVESLEIPFSTKERHLSLSASIGIALAPQNGNQVRALLKLADQAMYQAKASQASPVGLADDLQKSD
jgi:diguanylate cyclase (GGDEF)-like protein/PAS domain S-box-containing protein